ncbi:ABC transporter substrate-binding protein [bacterium M00.F.Ca.ET.228.01.1.1]|uniref:ABC transporter substrate-binding protein n=1 Tax=Paraburkholderia phenoliruptrix TaxID=252970 RepID=UPI00109323FD|nr:ABC transporter substrate-binding protein [Paraburkholderia phenoliruptrix]TGP42151.1 ABC transporter substrate-binding protein [bacterium M00.F.Ca.ET.228.01.1.1]TGR99582.1 ABC transporter substrate-binding protein [bacterium M00.F.Ca.ET.191.01.1.1]TGU03949.1 ABC transporter substrate-binding protein [bacterium M00.F.Ca.ET.155.01.1.1]MBW0448291.1 ABC transporter substrate-binding protein [Paraburkholderia phenoliruptrix]MBW9099502.1 ABC transporter substrate-binding protein [Paraburkholderi
MKKWVLSLGISVCAFHAHAQGPLVIRFGVDPTYPPFESKLADGSLVGFDIDLGNALCARLQAKCTWVENAFDGLIPALQARKFDAILSSLSITEERQKTISFTNPLYFTPSRLIAATGSGLAPDSASLHGKRIGVAQGSVQETYAKRHWATVGAEIVSYPDQEQVYPDLRGGRLDAAFQDSLAAKSGFLDKPQGKGFTFAGPPVGNAAVFGAAAIGVRKSDRALIEQLNQAQSEIKKDGTYARLAKKYFDFDPTP